MAVRIQKSAVNIREKLAELERPIGVNGAALMATSTPQEAFSLIGARNRNRIINGDMRISQRSTGNFTPTGTTINYNLDRFFTQQNASNNITLTRSSDAPPGFSNSLLLTMGTATTLEYMRVGTSIEGYNISDLAFGTSSAKTFTLSFWVKCSLTGNFGVGFRNGVDAAGNNVTTSRLASYTINNANTWEYKTITISGPTSGTWGKIQTLGMLILWDIGETSARSIVVDNTWQTSNTNYPVGLLGGTKVASVTGATWQITGVQLEEGRIATPFEFRSYGEELRLCQRYYCKSFNIETTPAGGLSYTDGEHQVQLVDSGDPQIVIYWPVVMRTTPGVTLYNPRSGGTAGQWSTLASDGANARAFNTTQIKTNIDNTDVALSATYWSIAWSAAAEL